MASIQLLRGVVSFVFVQRHFFIYIKPLFQLSAGLFLTLSIASANAVVALKGQLSVTAEGSANYTIPIKVPPGVAGLEPDLSLGYGSSDGNSLLGMGWGVNGLSEISRCPRTIAQDGVAGGVSYDANDRFCLDGERLISIGGAYGADGTQYRTEVASFSKVVSYGAAGTGPAWFKVWTKDGRILEYGNTADSRIEAAGKGVARLWGLNRISDRKANYIALSYLEDNPNGEAYISRVSYTGNATSGLQPAASVRFEYETRTDVIRAYEAGSPIQVSKRLSRVKTFNGETLVRDYRLTYEQGGATGRSRLKQVQECDGATPAVCLSPINFGWTDYQPGQAYTYWTTTNGSIGAGQSYVHHLLDVTGDGMADLVQIARTGNGMWVGKSLGNGSFQTWATNNGNIGGDTNYAHYFVDVNGDGVPDIVQIARSGNGMWVGLNDGNGNFQTWTVSNANIGGENTYAHYFADFNGDGRIDLLQVARANNNGWVALNDGNGNFQTWTTSSTNIGNANTYGHYVADLNGDGMADLVQVHRTSNSASIALNQGSGNFQYWTSSTSSIGALSNYTHYLADINGDGLVDWIQVANGSNNGWIGLNNGSGSFQYWTASSTNIGSGSNYVHYFADLNGDGNADIIQVAQNSNNGWLGLNNGNNNFNYWTSSSTSIGAKVNYEHYFADVNGDGLADHVQINTYSNGGGVSINSGKLPDLITLVTGQGRTDTIQYKPLTSADIYLKDSGSNASIYPAQDVQRPIYAVSSLATSDGIGGSLIKTYQYGGLKQDASGRGLLGFRWIKTQQLDSDIAETIFYKQGFPFKGEVSQSEKRTVSDNTLLGVQQFTYANTLLSAGSASVRYPHLVQATSQTFDLNGIQLSTNTTTQQHDAYGNVVLQQEDTGNGHTKQTANTYANDESKWLLGLLLKSQVTNTVPAPGPVSQPSTLSVSASPSPLVVNATQSGSASGTAVASPSGGVAPYSYQWVRISGSRVAVTGGKTATFNVVLGVNENFTESFQVTVTDAIGKTVTANINVKFTSPAAFTFNPVISSNVANYNVKAAAIAAGWDQIVPLNAVITVNSNVVVSSSATTLYAFDTGVGFPASSMLKLVNNGLIVGRGGDGGEGGGGTGYNNFHGYPGKNGGGAIHAQAQLTVINNGTIAGGGGGGGGGSTAEDWSYGGSGGGGGAGGSSGGVRGRAAFSYGIAGQPGSLTVPGNGGGGTIPGGKGGGYGAAGLQGNSADESGGAGGAGGPCVVGNSNITWNVPGNRYGAMN